MRTVELLLCDDERFADFNVNERVKPTQEALGYLMTWGLGSYPIVNIMFACRRGDPADAEFVACYVRKGENGEPDKRYVIGAIWNEAGKRFSFHS